MPINLHPPRSSPLPHQPVLPALPVLPPEVCEPLRRRSTSVHKYLGKFLFLEMWRKLTSRRFFLTGPALSFVVFLSTGRATPFFFFFFFFNFNKAAGLPFGEGFRPGTQVARALAAVVATLPLFLLELAMVMMLGVL